MVELASARRAVNLELRHLRYFVAVAEELHFSRAAARLHIAQPALSAQVRQIERALAVELLTRTTRRVELTPAGLALLEEARRVLAAADRAWAEVARAADGERGALRVGYTPSSAYDALPRLLAAAERRLPDLRVGADELWEADLPGALAEGRVDLALSRTTVAADGLGADALASALLWHEPLVAVLPASHRAASRRTLPLAALADEKFVLARRALEPAYHDLRVSICRAAGFEPRVIDDPTPGDRTWRLVAGGEAVSIAPASVALLPAPDVAFVPLRVQLGALPLHAVWRAGPTQPALRQLLEVVSGLGPPAECSPAQGRIAEAVR